MAPECSRMRIREDMIIHYIFLGNYDEVNRKQLLEHRRDSRSRGHNKKIGKKSDKKYIRNIS